MSFCYHVAIQGNNNNNNNNGRKKTEHTNDEWMMEQHEFWVFFKILIDILTNNFFNESIKRFSKDSKNKF